MTFAVSVISAIAGLRPDRSQSAGGPQTLATQKALLLAAGVERIFSEKVSGVAAKRPELERALDQLEAGEDRKSTRLNSSHSGESRMPSSA